MKRVHDDRLCAELASTQRMRCQPYWLYLAKLALLVAHETLNFEMHHASVQCLTQTPSFGAWLYDDHLLTCDLKKRHIGLHNHTSAAIWLLLSDGIDDEDLFKHYADLFALPLVQARHDVEQCLADWHSKGWVERNVAKQWCFCLNDEQVSTDSTAFGFIEHAPLVDHEIHRGVYCFGDVPFELQIRSTCMAEIDQASQSKLNIHSSILNDSPLSSWPLSASAKGFSERLMAICGGFTKLDALPEGAGWVTVSLVGEDIILQDSNNQHPRRLESELAMGLVYEAMIGVSGVGKSTLSALLAHAGWELLGDDIVAIEINQSVQQTPSLGLLRFPTAISLKSGSWPSLMPLYPELAGLPVFPYAYGEKHAKYLPLVRMSAQQTVSTWNAIVLPRFVLNQTLKVQALRPALGLQGLLTAGMSLFGEPTVETIDHALNALIKLPCFYIEYGHFDEVNACLKELKID